MDELQKLLSDPGAMERVSQMARELMGGAPPPGPEGGPPPVGDLGAVLRGLSGGKGAGGVHPLAAALGPYLDEGRRQRLARALTAARAVGLSGSLRGRGGHEL